MRKNILLVILMAVVFHFHAGAATEIEKHWNVDSYLYSFNMTVVGVVEIDGVEQGNTSLEVGAFCGTECRGSEMVRYFPQVERYLVFLTVYGEDEESISFRLYDHDAGEELDVYIEDMSFVIDAMQGTPSYPYEFNFISLYSVAISVNPEGAGTTTGEGHYFANETVTLSATPNAGWRFVSWTENEVVVSTEPSFQLVIDGKRSFVANFEMILHHVDLAVNYAVCGTVSGAGDYQEGTLATVSATPNEGYEFFRWTLDGTSVSTDKDYTFTVTSPVSLLAEFKLQVTDTTAASCDAFEWYGETYTSSGNYQHTCNSYLGLDSIVALHLTIHPSYHYHESQTACDEYTWRETTYTESGDYTVPFQTIHGCDSIYTLHLTVNTTFPLGTFTYMTPANNYVNRYPEVEFYWDGVVNANQYDFYFWEDGGDRPTTPTIANSTSVTAQRSGLEHGVTYHWCVVAKNECVEIESSERTFVCQLTPALSVLPQGGLDFGEVEVGQSLSKNISVSGTALPVNISYAFLENEYGADAEFFTITPAANWDASKGGTLQVTFTPVADQLYYSSAIRIVSDAIVDTVYLSGSMANRYVFTTQVDGDLFTANDSITITGHVEDVLGNVVPGLDVDVYLMVMGTRITRWAVSDENGDYSITYVPRNSESGYYQVGSCERNKRVTTVHDDFDVPGMSINTSGYVKWELYQNDTLTGSFSIRNRSRIPLGAITVTAVSLPQGCNVEFGNLTLGALETKELHFTVTGDEVTPGNTYQEAVFSLTASDGTTMNLICFYYCLKRRGDMDVYPSSVTTSMKCNGQKVLSFQVTNNGNGETGAIFIDLPDVSWMRMMGADTLPSLAVGDSLSFSLLLAPDENVELGSYSGSFAVNCANGNGFIVPYDLEATSDSTGVLMVDVTDDYTYNTNNRFGPHLAGASVLLVGYYSLDTVAHGYTDGQGLFSVDTIPEGWYYLTVSAKDHKEYEQGIVYIEGGKTNIQDIYLQFEPISVSWEVVPTEVADEYELIFVTHFKTNVPVPVVVVEFPPIDTMAYGDSIQIGFTVSNHGLIDAREVQLSMPTEYSEYAFFPLFDFIDTLYANSSIVIPCVVTRTLSRDGDTDECKNGNGRALHWYHCNYKKEWVEHTFPVVFRRRCNNPIIHVIDPPTTPPSVHPVIPPTIPPTPPIPPDKPNPGQIYPPSIVGPTPIVATTNSQDCTPCWKVVVSLLADFVGGCSLLNDVFDCFLFETDYINPYEITSSPNSELEQNISLLQCVDNAIVSNLFSTAIDLVLDFTGLGFIGRLYSIVTSFNDIIDRLSGCISFSNPNRDMAGFELSMEQLELSVNYGNALVDILTNLFQEEEWMEEEHLDEFLINFATVVDSVNHTVSPQATQHLKEITNLSNVNDSIVQCFVDRWNRSVQYWNEGIFTTNDLPEGYDSSFIVLDSTMYQPLQEAREGAESYGFNSVGEMLESSYDDLTDVAQEHNSDVCAKVSVQFKQTMAMTREAFEGTLRITNGHMTDPMQDIAVNIVIKNETGVDCTDLFQINTTSMTQITGIDGTGSLDAQKEGVVQFMMIPTIEAAPEEPVIYSFGGSFTFLDPFSGEEMTYRLYPVDLTVNPGPNLYIDYFVQRNIISDDPLTEDTIEPMEEAEIAMMIRNLGAGDAKNVYLESSQPKIVQNENNLLIDFDLSGSAMNGEHRPLAMSNIPFGTIASHTNGIAEWYYTSTLIGRVISSTAHVIHNNSYDNPQLSLVSAVNTHELIKGISAYGDLDDGINDFLVNEISDFGHLPDKLYFSHGDTTNVIQADSLRALDSVTPLNNTVVVELYPHAPGWNYATVADPGMGQCALLSCTRSDGQEIPLNNVWITHVTIPNDDVPVHENILHLVDTLPTGEMMAYTLVYEELPCCETTIHAIELMAGWNWWSTYIDLAGDGLVRLEDSLGTNGEIIKSIGAFVMYQEGEWFGGLNALNNQSMYMIRVNANQTFSLTGARVNPVQHPIALTPGWNWIGYPLTTTQSVENALSQLEPDHGDVLKSINKFTTFDSEYGGWFGGLLNMTPGQGYMYMANQSHSFQYGEGRGSVVVEADAPSYWATNTHAFADNMSVVAVVSLDGAELHSDAYEVAAFSAGQCLGTARLLYHDLRGRYYALIPVSGEEGMEVSFRLCQADGSEFQSQAAETCVFAVNGVYGSLDEPLVLHFNSTTGLKDEWTVLKLFPNPVERGGEVFLTMPHADGKKRVEIYNMLDVLVGTQEIQESSFLLDKSLAAGTYLIRVYVGTDKLYYGKLIVH